MTSALSSKPPLTKWKHQKKKSNSTLSTPRQVESLSCSGKLHDSAFLVEPDEFTLCDDIKERVGDACMVHYQFANSKGYEMCTIEFDDGYCHCVVAQCLETEFEREERECLEAAYQLYYKSFKDAYGGTPLEFANWKEAEAVDLWLAIVDKTGYRKQ